MKNWLLKFRRRLATNAAEQSLASLAGKLVNRAGLRQYLEDSRRVEQVLCQAHPRKPVPEMLHESIMQAVLAAGRQQPARVVLSRGSVRSLRWVSAGAAALLLVALGGWFYLHSAGLGSHPVARVAPVLASAQAALELGQEATQSLPLLATAPLARELEDLNRDLTNTTRFVLASLP